ncbi:MAG: Rossmann fold domain-containing protein [Erythrobacter sp.]|uniref:Rossmann fold domain-containing protein n=1 Tax=Erythrobacter sp. TaxID=1042 RepID=UPI003263514C
MALAQYQVSELPESPLEASAAFFAEHLDAARSVACGGDLLIILPTAGPDHADWRQAVARDMARDAAPSRVNVIGAGDQAQKETLIRYLADAKGVTGHYSQTND